MQSSVSPTVFLDREAFLAVIDGLRMVMFFGQVLSRSETVGSFVNDNSV